MPGISFDQAVGYYDTTRNFVEGVAERIRDALLDFVKATPSTRFLELGVGTGRVAWPFIAAGYDYTGVDLSLGMMGQIEEKLKKDGAGVPRPRLVQADVTGWLPFQDNSFDVILAVHVLHLVDGWQATLDEARRVLQKPDGYLIIARDENAKTDPDRFDPRSIVNAKWDEIVTGLGIDSSSLRPGGISQSDQKIEAYLQEHGASTQAISLTRVEHPPISIRMMVDRHVLRMYSADWKLPDEIHAKASQEIRQWLEAECSEPDRLVANEGEFKALVARWP